MTRPVALRTHPSPLLAGLAGTVGVLILGAGIYLAPLAGVPFLDFPRLVGGVFAASPQLAFWLGWAVVFLTGTLLFPLLLAYFWPQLPGRPVGLAGPLLKGLLWGLGLWLLAGLLLPALAALGRLDPALPDPGFFTLGRGGPAFAAVLLGHLAYGATLGLVLAMGQGLGILEMLGSPAPSEAGAGAGAEPEGAA